MESYSCAVFLLKNKSKRVLDELDRNAIVINSRTKIIAFSFHSYDEIELKKIADYLSRKHPDFKDLPRTDANKIRSEFLKKIKIPGRYNYTHISQMLIGIKVFNKLIQPDKILAGVVMERTVLEGVEGYHCIQKITDNKRRIYAIQLDGSIRNDSAFVKLNPHWNGESEAFYVGQTSKEREERYIQHTAGEKSNKYVRKYGLKPFEKADATERLVQELTGNNIQIIAENLRYYQALYYERKLTLELRKRGYAAYSN